MGDLNPVLTPGMFDHVFVHFEMYGLKEGLVFHCKEPNPVTKMHHGYVWDEESERWREFGSVDWDLMKKKQAVAAEITCLHKIPEIDTYKAFSRILALYPAREIDYEPPERQIRTGIDLIAELQKI